MQGDVSERRNLHVAKVILQGKGSSRGSAVQGQYPRTKALDQCKGNIPGQPITLSTSKVQGRDNNSFWGIGQAKAIMDFTYASP